MGTIHVILHQLSKQSEPHLSVSLRTSTTHAHPINQWVPWTSRRSNQLTLKEINPEYSLEGQMLKQKLQYFGHLMLRADSLEKSLMLIEIEGRRRGWQRMRRLHGMTDSMDMNLSNLWEILKDREDWHGCSPWDHKESNTTEWLNNSNPFLCSYLAACSYTTVMYQISSYSDSDRSMPQMGISFNSEVFHCPSAWLYSRATACGSIYTQTSRFFWLFIPSLQGSSMLASQLRWCVAIFIKHSFPRSHSWCSGLSKSVLVTVIHKPSIFLLMSWNLFIVHPSDGNRIRRQLRWFQVSPRGKEAICW